MAKSNAPMEAAADELDRVTIFLHLGLAVFGVAAWLVGSGIIGAGADDYDHPDHFWYLQHRWIGITFAVFLLARLVWGFVGPASVRFVNWVPWTRARFHWVVEDLRLLAHFKVPERPPHVGIAGLVQSLGLILFVWLALSGLTNAIAITPGMKLEGWPRVIKYWHAAAGGLLIPAYLILHVGGTIAHSLAGKGIWKKMLFLK